MFARSIEHYERKRPELALDLAARLSLHERVGTSFLLSYYFLNMTLRTTALRHHPIHREAIPCFIGYRLVGRIHNLSIRERGCGLQYLSI